MSGDTIVITARRDDDGGSESGSAHVFVGSGATWNTWHRSGSRYHGAMHQPAQDSKHA